MTASLPAKPEGDWRYRRIYVYLLSEQLVLLLAVICFRLPPELLRGFAYALLGVLTVVLTFYLVAPSATEIIRFVTEARPGLRLPGARPPQETEQ